MSFLLPFCVTIISPFLLLLKTWHSVYIFTVKPFRRLGLLVCSPSLSNISCFYLCFININRRSQTKFTFAPRTASIAGFIPSAPLIPPPQVNPPTQVNPTYSGECNQPRLVPTGQFQATFPVHFHLPKLLPPAWV